MIDIASRFLFFYWINLHHRVIIGTKQREHVCLPVKRIFSSVKRRPPTPPKDKSEIGYTAISGERRIHSSPSETSPPPPQLLPLANEIAVSSDVAHSGRENLHQFLPILLWRHAIYSSIMTLWFTLIIVQKRNDWH